MAKFTPKKVDSVDAEHWDHSNPVQVAVFMKFTADHDLGVTFCSGMEGGVAAEIYKQNIYHFDVEPWSYLVVEGDGSIKVMSEGDFTENYGPVS